MKKLILSLLITLVVLPGFALDFTYIYNNQTLTYTVINSTDKTCEVKSGEISGKLEIPSTVTYLEKTYRVTSIGQSAFKNCSSLTSVIIPNSVTSIGDSAFYGCSSLTSVIIPNSVTSIGGSAFNGCWGLKKSAYPNTLSNPFDIKYAVVAYEPTGAIVEDGFIFGPGKSSILFAPYTLKGEYTIPNSVTSIGASAFYNCHGLTSVIIPNSVTSIGTSAFYNCDGLTSVIIPNSVTSIGNDAFNGCFKLTSVIIPNSVTSIGRYVFQFCSGLKKAAYPNTLSNPFFDGGFPGEFVVQYDPKSAIVKDGFIFGPGKSSILFAPYTLKGEYTIPNSVTSIGSYAFSQCSGLTSVTIPNSVTSIGQSAFKYCSGLASVTIPNSVTSIGDDAFYRCSGLTSVTIPNSVTSIGNTAFGYCRGLTSVTIPSSVTSINGAFKGCSGLTSVIIPNSVTSINGAFKGCSGLTSVIIPNSVTSIGSYAFEDCSGLTSVTIPNSVTSIGSYAFNNCNKLTSVTIPNSVTSIGSYAFNNCNKLTSVTIPNSVTRIASYAFQNCSGLTSVIIPNSVTSIENSAFSGCNRLEKSAYPNTLSNPFQNGVAVAYEPTGAIVEDGFIFGPGKSSIQFAPDTLKGEYTIPNSVTSIGDKAFYGCSGLKKSAYPKTLSKPFEYTFAIAYEPIGAIVEDGFVFGPEKSSILFASCTLKGEYTIPNSVTSIGSEAFYDCSGLTSVIIPNSVTSIGSEAFYDCSGLTSVIIGNSVTSIGNNAFEYCSGLKKSAYPKTLSNPFPYGITVEYNPTGTIVEDGFVFGPEKSSIRFAPYTLEGEYTIPNSVTSIDSYAFKGCSGLTSVTFSNSVTSIGIYAFYKCSGLTSVTIPNSVTSIREYAFADCSGLTSVTIPNSVTSISERAFSQCKLTEVVVPPSVETIGHSAFLGNSGLNKIAMGYKVKTIDENAFQGANANSVFITAQVPPKAPYSTFSRYAGKLYVQGKTAVGAYYDALTCWNKFAGYAMSEPQSLTMEKPKMVEGKAGEQFTLKAVLTPANVDLPYIFWRSTNPKKAYVDNEGKVTILQNITADDNVEIIAETLYYRPIAKFSFFKDSSGVDEIVGDTTSATSTIDVYTLQGVQVLRNATQEDFDKLDSGIYIVRSGKNVKKVIK